MLLQPLKKQTNYILSPRCHGGTFIIDASLKKVDATKHWNAVFTAYNRFSADKVNPDLAAYVTEKALYGIFHQLGQEEQKIRKDPLARREPERTRSNYRCFHRWLVGRPWCIQSFAEQ